MEEKDLQLIRSAKHGSKEAFALLVQNYKQYVYRTAYGILQSRTDAEDVVQEAFIKAYLSLAQLQEERSFPSWITTITTRLAIDLIKKRQRASPVTWDDSWLQIQDPKHDISHTELRLSVHHALAELNEDHRAILILREIHGFDYQEIANILQIPIGTVRSRLHSARMQLRKTLENHL
ncbi:sigma-70 family RNA polymerase sigma factor [Fodinisporobacter ferrooxydans]|uniref:RNA polymerase sigma factor n=1 Tax=Fodinisporobacter ferrooxydans TaxID=2901836 RepID=A0ABY4CS52_9BACL|nr:sigma-70 family RNA polymerase sigma factor [Alicyclobacillaceae bacterium MYW30-H2]